MMIHIKLQLVALNIILQLQKSQVQVQLLAMVEIFLHRVTVNLYAVYDNRQKFPIVNHLGHKRTLWDKMIEIKLYET